MHESSNKAISAHRGRSRSHAERNSVNIQIFAAFLCFVSLFQLQPVLYLAKCMVVFDTVTAHLAFAQFLLKQELPSKQKKKKRISVTVSRDKELIKHCRDKPS